jgi:hypothetical protein
MSVRRTASLVSALTGVVLLAGCGSSSGGTTFKTQPGLVLSAASQTCLVHQSKSPTAAYKGGPSAATTDELTFLAYYTANGNKKFCDGKPANAKDKQWAALYVSLDSQAAAKNVKGITG